MGDMSTAEKMPLAPKAKDMSLAKKVVRFGSAVATATSFAGVGTAHAGTIENTASTPGMPATIVEQKSTTEKYQEALTQAGLSTAQSEQPATPGESETKDLGILTPEGPGGTEAPPTQETPEIVATPGESETFQESYKYEATDKITLTPTGANSANEAENWKMTVTRDGKTYEFKISESQKTKDDAELWLGNSHLGSFGKEDDRGNINAYLAFVGVETGTITYGDQNQFSADMHYLIVAIPSEDGTQTLLVKFPRYDGSKIMNPNSGSATPIPEAFEYFDRLPAGHMILTVVNTKDFTKEDILKENKIPDEATCLKDDKCARGLYVWTTLAGKMKDLLEWQKTGSADKLVFDEDGRAIVNILASIYK